MPRRRASWINPPAALLLQEVQPHADFAVHQALCSPLLSVPHCHVARIGDDTWRIEAGVANEGWLATDITALARKEQLVKPITVEISARDGSEIEVIDGPARRKLGQLAGRAALRFSHGNDGTPERVLTSWVVRAPAGSTVRITATHDRAGRVTTDCVLG